MNKTSDKTILHLSTLPLWDLGKGKGRVSTYLPLKAMVDEGYKLIYVTNNISQPSGNDQGIEVKHISTPFSDSRVCFQLLLYPLTVLLFILHGLWICRHSKPSIVYAHATLLALPAYILSKIVGGKYVLRLYGIGKGANRPLIPSGILLRIAFCFKADKYILTNDGTNAKAIAISLGADEKNICFLRNGIKKDIDFTPNNQLKNQLTPNGEVILLSVSRLSNWKHIDDIIRMMVPLKEKQVKFKLVIIGDGPERSYLEELSTQLDLSNTIVFTGALAQKDVFKYDLISDVFISLNELSSMSNPVFEAMLAGCTVIAWNRGTTEEMIKDGENGILIQEIEQLPDALYNVISNPKEAAQIGRNAKKYMLEHWPSWEERIEEELKILRSL